MTRAFHNPASHPALAIEALPPAELPAAARVLACGSKYAA
ncbi:MAG: hypothetical protein RL385_1130 [Pseudomonadota bacterium]|jgi:hypothetical protein